MKIKVENISENSKVIINGKRYYSNNKKINFKDIVAYIQGNVRYKLYYSKFNFLIPLYIKEQIDSRILSMKPECYSTGSCIMCGCKTTALQMADKSCDGGCYPKMLTKSQWSELKKNKINWY